MNSTASFPDNPRSITRNLRNLQISAPLRAEYIYCNMMYTVATHLVETETGQTFADFLDDRFFKPLAMDSSNLGVARASERGLADRVVTGYTWDKDANVYRGLSCAHCPEAQGAGSIMTSVNDYIKWVRAMMNRQDPITDDMYWNMIEARSFPNPRYESMRPLTSPTMYAAGWEIYYYRGHMVVSHDGCVPGFAATHLFLPDLSFGVTLFANSSGGGNVNSVLTFELIDALINVPRAQRLDWNKIEDELAEAEDETESVEDLRQQICPGLDEPQPLKMPLAAYTGEYWNPGYHGMTVQVKDGRLFIDATDRSMGFTLTFEHLAEQTKFIAQLRDMYEGDDVPLEAEFRFENDTASKMGLHLEPDLDDLIWFSRVEGDVEMSTDAGPQSHDEVE